MRAATQLTKITEGVRYTGPLGQWAELRFDSQGGYRPGYGPTGVFYVETGAPWFPEGAVDTIGQSCHRDRSVRALRAWVALTVEPPAVG